MSIFLQFTSAKLTIIAGPCMLESLSLGLQVGEFLQEQCLIHDFNYVFKASFDKANRTSNSGKRGPGLQQGLNELQQIKEHLKVPILTDVHTPEQAIAAAQVVDILQIPAFLCQDKALLAAAFSTQKVVQIKKGQHLTGIDMLAIAKMGAVYNNSKIILCERGTCFGYNNLVVDFRDMVDMKNQGFPVVFDATHAAQLPGAGNGQSSGLRYVVPSLARAAVAIGIEGLFLEVHPNPAQALSDAATQLDFASTAQLLKQVKVISQALAAI